VQRNLPGISHASKSQELTVLDDTQKLKVFDESRTKTQGLFDSLNLFKKLFK